MIAAVYALVFILMLAAPYVAEAECAWVLWTEGTSTFGEGWSPVWAHGTQRDCATSVLDKVKSEVAKAKQRGDAVEVLGGPQGNTLITNSGTTDQRITRYICLPDTIDPRGAKGGGR